MKFTLRQIRRTVLLAILVVLAFGVGWWSGTHELRIKNNELRVKNFQIVNKSVPQDKNLDFSLFWRVWDKLQEKYLEKSKLDSEKMFYGAIQGMVAALGDPYTVFLPPSENKQVMEDLNGSFEGVGIQLGFNKDKRLVVVAPLKGSPAEAVGVRAADLILHLKDVSKNLDLDTSSLTLPEVVEKIRGPQGTKITLTLMHENEDKPYEVEVVRQTIIVPSVEVVFLEDNQLAHLKLTRFGELTDSQWEKSVNKILENKQTVKGLILDVRGNPGGYLKGAVDLAAEFLKAGVVVKQEDYQGQIETYSVNRKGRLLDLAMVVLIDKGSASASEILAAALQDHKRAKLIGETSFGKGTIQESETINGDAGLHITTAKWLTPNGNWLNEKGLTPDLEVKNDPEKQQEDFQLQKAVELLLNK